MNSSLTIKPILNTNDLSPGYKTGSVDNPLFHSLNLSLHAGELVCLMGPNGSGKSTLIRTLARLQKPLSGTITGAGEKGVGVVLTDRITSTSMTVNELVTFGRYPYLSWNIALTPEDRAIVDEAISSVRIEYLAEKKIAELSDGQLQMAMIARALAQQTPVLLLDEPTAHLDLNNRVEVMNLLRKLTRAKNKAILLATHELDLALQTADLIWLATANKKIKTGIPEDLVLDGSLDEVFQFKGYDLKTGKVTQASHQSAVIAVLGTGHEYRWTKNALERNGFEVSESGSIIVTIENSPRLGWQLEGKLFYQLRELIHQLRTNP